MPDEDQLFLHPAERAAANHEPQELLYAIYEGISNHQRSTRARPEPERACRLGVSVGLGLCVLALVGPGNRRVLGAE
jgi:hypothetical protein